VKIPFSAIANPLTAPLNLSSRIILAVPKPWEVIPMDNPLATLSLIPTISNTSTPTAFPIIPVKITRTAVKAGMPPIFSLTPIAIAVVMLLGAMLSRTISSAPKSFAT